MPSAIEDVGMMSDEQGAGASSSSAAAAEMSEEARIENVVKSQSCMDTAMMMMMPAAPYASNAVAALEVLFSALAGQQQVRASEMYVNISHAWFLTAVLYDRRSLSGVSGLTRSRRWLDWPRSHYSMTSRRSCGSDAIATTP